MNKLMMLISHVSKFLRVIGAVLLTGMMFLTVTDVILSRREDPFGVLRDDCRGRGACYYFILPQNSLADQNVCGFFWSIPHHPQKKLFMIGRRIPGLRLPCIRYVQKGRRIK